MFEELKRYTRWLATWLMVAYFVAVMIGKSPLSRDDTDSGEWGERSGVALRTDYKTGCQYLESINGGLTPRRDGAGRHVGCRAP